MKANRWRAHRHMCIFNGGCSALRSNVNEWLSAQQPGVTSAGVRDGLQPDWRVRAAEIGRGSDPVSEISPIIVQSLATEIALAPVFGPIRRGKAAALRRWKARRSARRPRHRSRMNWLARTGRCCVRWRRATRTGAPRLPRGHLGRAKTGSLVRRLAF